MARAAFKDSSSKYYVNGKGSTWTIVTELLQSKGIDLENNRFLILQVGADHPCRRPAAAPSRAAAREHGAVGFRP